MCPLKVAPGQILRKWDNVYTLLAEFSDSMESGI